MADLKLGRLLDAIDRWLVEHPGHPLASLATPDSAEPAMRFAPTHVAADPMLTLDLAKARIGTILWATGFRPDFHWLQAPVFDRKGRLRHDGGVVDAPGLYVLGLNFMRRRKSSFIHGAEDDVREIGGHLAAYLRSGVAAPARLAVG